MKRNLRFTHREIDAAKKVMETISEDLRSHHSLRKLVQTSATNHYTLKKILRTVFRTSIYQFRIFQRMEHAKRELASTNKLIADIADELGYGNAEYFSRCFRKIVGLSPTQYRLNHRNTNHNN